MLLNCVNLSFGISQFIATWLSDKQSFECRSFYGETFSLALLYRTGNCSDEIRRKLLSAYDSLDKIDSEFHWEFNNYALLDYYSQSQDKDVTTYLEALIFKNTACTNWTLLRSNSRLKAGVDIDKALNEAKEKIKKFQLPSGLILDDPGVRSFQYHCFSMAMIGEIFEQTNDFYFYDSFIKGVEFIRKFILSNGDTLYIGRGQKQSFGYGALAYILALAYRYTTEKSLLGDIDRILKYLKLFQREDGSFPLMLNGVEKNIPKVVDMTDPQFVGWYPYNNYFDYLPFMGFFLNKTSELLKEADVSDLLYKNQESYRDADFIKIVRLGYEAVLSRPCGYWSNDQPIPYIVTDQKAATPCYGGEQFQKSLYSTQGIPLPYSDTLNRSIRWRSISWFYADSLWLISPLGIMRRNYLFEDGAITITTSIISIFTFVHNYLFCSKQMSVRFDMSDLTHVNCGYSACGKLDRYVSHKKYSKLKLRINS